jgi:hypothetical protein
MLHPKTGYSHKETDPLIRFNRPSCEKSAAFLGCWLGLQMPGPIGMPIASRLVPKHEEIENGRKEKEVIGGNQSTVIPCGMDHEPNIQEKEK